MHMHLEPGVHRLRTRTATADVAAQLTRAGWSVAVVDISGAADKAGLLDGLAADLRFPEWVGRNWDALADALGDLSWWEPGQRGRALVIAGASHLDDALLSQWSTLCAILAEAAERWSATPTPLGVLVRGRALG